MTCTCDPSAQVVLSTRSASCDFELALAATAAEFSSQGSSAEGFQSPVSQVRASSSFS